MKKQNILYIIMIGLLVIILIMISVLCILFSVEKKKNQENLCIEYANNSEFANSKDEVDKSANIYSCSMGILDEYDDYDVSINIKLSYDDYQQITNYYAYNVYEFNTDEAYNRLKDKEGNDIVGTWAYRYKNSLITQGFDCGQDNGEEEWEK